MTSPITSRDVTVKRAICDGCDGPRPCEEHTPAAHLWLVTSGAFELRDRRGRHAVDPTRALVLAANDPFTIRHPAGPDICLSIRGPLVEQLAQAGSRQLALDAQTAAHIAAATRAGDAFALAELIATLAPEPADDDRARAPAHEVRRHDRDLAHALAHELRLHFAEQQPLSDLCEAAGTSIFHACRVFRRATGTTLHGYRRELRLRHALAMLIDGDAPLADIATAAGFASQSHLTNLFRARFNKTPGAVRTARAI
jgi:AraC-like DNA-binding protein